MGFAHFYMHYAQYRGLVLSVVNQLNTIVNMTYNHMMVPIDPVPDAARQFLSGGDAFPLDRKVLFRTTELTQAEQRISKLVQPMFHSKHDSSVHTDICVSGVTLEKLRLFGVSYGTPVFIQSAPIESYHVLIPLRGHLRTKINAEPIQVEYGEAIICATGTSLRIDWSAQCVIMVVIVPNQEFEQTLVRHCPFVPALLPPVTRVNLGEGIGGSFANLLSCLCAECNNQGNGDTRTISIGLQELLLISLMKMYIHENTALPVLKGTQRRKKGVARAMEYIRKNTHRALSLDELAKSAYLSPRSLQTGFNESLGMGPMKYSKYVRLACAHETLIKEHDLSIAEIAMQYGFGNTGTFSRLYKERYGEFPSAVIRRTEKSSGKENIDPVAL